MQGINNSLLASILLKANGTINVNPEGLGSGWQTMFYKRYRQSWTGRLGLSQRGLSRSGKKKDGQRTVGQRPVDTGKSKSEYSTTVIFKIYVSR